MGEFFMPSILLNSNMFENLSNEDLLDKQEELEIKYSKALVIKAYTPEMLSDMDKVLKIIDNEITKRLENGTMDEDELKDEL
jgi:hypothetical protein